MKHKVPINIVAIIPSFYKNNGEGVNERQFINALSKHVKKIYVFTFEDIRKLMKVKKQKLNLPKNIIQISIPLIKAPLISTMLMIFTSYLLSFILLIFDYIIGVELIYIRYSLPSIGIITLKPLASKVVVKIPSIIEDEIRYRGLTNKFIKKFIVIIEKIVLLKAKVIAVPSKELYREILKRRNVQRIDNFIEAMPGLDLDFIEKIKRTPYEKRNLKRKIFTVGFIGSLVWWQGIDTLIKAIALLRRQSIPIHLLIIGDGPQRPIIENMLKVLKVSYEITGSIPHKEALKLLKRIDMLVLPRPHTSFTEFLIPMKVLEAWALGVPIIVTRHKIFTSLGIKDYEDLIYCEPNPKNVAERLLCLLRNDNLRLKLAMKGSKIAKRFTYNRVIDELLNMTTKTTSH